MSFFFVIRLSMITWFIFMLRLLVVWGSLALHIMSLSVSTCSNDTHTHTHTHTWAGVVKYMSTCVYNALLKIITIYTIYKQCLYYLPKVIIISPSLPPSSLTNCDPNCSTRDSIVAVLCHYYTERHCIRYFYSSCYPLRQTLLQ